MKQQEQLIRGGYAITTSFRHAGTGNGENTPIVVSFDPAEHEKKKRDQAQQQSRDI